MTDLCSVYRPDLGRYDYYRCRGPVRPATGYLPNAIGLPVDRALPRLPAGARKIGSGEQPLGALALDVGALGELSPMLIAVGAFALLYFLLGGRKKIRDDAL